MKVIQGDTKPKAEQKNLYQLNTLIPDYTTSIFSQKNDIKYVWTLYKSVNNRWKQVEDNIKYGEKNHYTFGQGVVGIPFKIMIHSQEKNILQATETKLVAELTVVPRTAKEPVIGRVILLNKNNTDVNKAKFNESLTAQARTSNLLGKEITFYLWEEGTSEFEKYKKPKKGTVNKHGIAEVKFNLSEYASPQTWMTFFQPNSNATKKFYVSAVYEDKKETNRTPVTATNGQPQTPRPQQPTNPSQTNRHPQNQNQNQGSGILSATRDVIAEGLGSILHAVENAVSPAQVNPQPTKNKQEEGKCPNCDKAVTSEDLKTIFPNASEENLKVAADTYTKYMKDLGMNTCWNKAHFFAQAMVEGGKSLNLKDGEGFNYSAEALPDNFTAFSANGKRYGPPNELAYKYGRSKQNNFKADQKKIANIAYSKRAELGNIGGDDGWNFRGRGLIQITGREIYTFCKPYTMKFENEDVLTNPDLVGHKISLGVSTSMIFFLWKKNKKGSPLNKLTLGTKDVKGKICPFVGNNVDIKNKAGVKITSNYDEKQKSFDDVTSIVFKVNECKLTKDKKDEQPNNSKVVIKFGANADKTVVSEKSLNLLRQVGEETKNFLITITSTARDPYNQARVMYDNIVKKGMKEQRNTYKPPGQRILDAYEHAKAKGKDRNGIIKEMEAKIKEIGPSKVSRHCGDPNIVNVFDVSQGMSNPQSFKRTITPKIATVLDENSCYHLEINQ